MNLPRRSLFQAASAWLAGGSTIEKPAPHEPQPCVTPSYAGFDGSFLLNTHVMRSRLIKLARCYADNPQRWGIGKGMLALWRNRDESVSKVVYRNRDGKLFELKFVAMEEPS